MNNLDELLREIRRHVKDPEKGLPEEIFLFATEITPMVNVDLLIRNQQGKILLAWRDDKFYGKGWHVPGGILRLKENFEERIQKTALSEIGSRVLHSASPIEVVPIISRDMKIRSHFITFVYECSLPGGYEPDNGTQKETDSGYLAWHLHYPENMLEVHNFYKKYFM